MLRAVFLDRDGVLNLDKGYTYKAEDLSLLPGVSDGLKALKDHGFKLIVITNQSGIARGFYSLKDVDSFHAAMQKQLEAEVGISIDRFYVCPHLEDGTVPLYTKACDCRKPGTKNIEVAMRELGIDAKKSFMVGDRLSDMEAGKKAGLKTVLILGNSCGQEDILVSNFSEAVAKILAT